jgi:hypothetical protein
MVPDIDLGPRLAGGMLGLLVGDAVGVPCEFRPQGAIGTVEFRGHGSPGVRGRLCVTEPEGELPSLPDHPLDTGPLLHRCHVLDCPT